MRPFFWATLVAAAAMSACGGSSTPPAAAPQQPKAATVKEAITNMEASGVTPALDRSASVAGPDANANGARDDVETYVASLADTAEQKQALLAMSKALTTAMTTAPNDANGLRQATGQMTNAVACIWQKYASDQADQKGLEMRKVTVNTRARYDAYMAYNAAVAGTVVKLPREVTCG